MSVEISASRCFSFVYPLLSNNFIDSSDAYTLGYCIGKHGTDKMYLILDSLEKLLEVSKNQAISPYVLSSIRLLILENNWDSVFYYQIG